VIQGLGGDPSLELESETWTLPSQLQEKYGDVFTVHLGFQPALTLGFPKLLHQTPRLLLDSFLNTVLPHPKVLHGGYRESL